MSNLVVLGWAHEKSDFWVTYFHSIFGWSFLPLALSPHAVHGSIWLTLSLHRTLRRSSRQQPQSHPVNHHKMRRKFVTLQNERFRILKTNRNWIVNDFDKPYICILTSPGENGQWFISWVCNHVLTFFYLVLSLVGVSIYHYFYPLGK